MNIREIQDKNHFFEIKRKPLDQLIDWVFEDDYSLRHKTNGFFTFVGIEQINHNKNILILQNEIGFLCIYIRFKNKDFKEQEFLLQRKQEPGNKPITQLSPSIQMTYSNLIGRHGGKSNKLNLIDKNNKNIIYIYLKHEQSDSFLMKKNLNFLSFYDSDLETKNLLKTKNNIWIKTLDLIDYILLGDIIHSDTRSVLFLYFATNVISIFNMKKLNKINQELKNKINIWGFKNQKSWRFVNIKDITRYTNGILEFQDENNVYNKKSISGFSIKTNNRLIKEWDQPLLVTNKKIFDLIYTKNSKEISILISLNSSPGTLNNVEFLPTFTNFEKELDEKFKNSSSIKLVHQSNQSDEGGRFWNRSNLYRIFYSDDLSIYKDKIIISLPELIYFYKNSNYISMELRSICVILFSVLIKSSWKSQ